jgi:hypothetical protein
MIHKFYKKYDNFYIDINIEESPNLCIFFDCNSVHIKTNINDFSDQYLEERKRAINDFKIYIKTIVPKHLIDITITEFDNIIYYYIYNNFHYVL